MDNLSPNERGEARHSRVTQPIRDFTRPQDADPSPDFSNKSVQTQSTEGPERVVYLYEDAPIGIVLLRDGHFAYVNPKASQIAGYTVEEMTGQMNIYDLVFRRDREDVRAALLRCENGQVEQVQVRVAASRKEGEKVQVEVHGRRVLFGGTPAVLCYLIDVTREHALEEQLVQVQEVEQRRLGKELHDGVASHLTGISMLLDRYIHALRQGDEVGLEQLQKLKGKVNDGIERVRSLSRGLSPTALGTENLPDVLRDFVQHLDAGFEGECRFQEEGDARSISVQEAPHLYRIAQEAATNAVRHSRGSRVCIRLSWNADHLVLAVDDDGEGFTADGDERGVGLASMRRRARQIGADLTIESNLGEGTTVRCRLSLEEVPKTIT